LGPRFLRNCAQNALLASSVGRAAAISDQLLADLLSNVAAQMRKSAFTAADDAGVRAGLH
jgi:hypothetical protein